MKVQSTGLGKTVMIAQFKDLLNTDFDKQQVLQMTMEATLAVCSLEGSSVNHLW